jgi:hypothetical protein
MNNFINVDNADKYMCPPFKNNCVEPNYDPSIESFIGMIYSAIASIFFWIGIFSLIRWIR